MTDISAIHAFDKWWNTQPEPHISAPKQCHVGMQQERMMTIWMVAFEAGRQQGIRQERALWELSAMTQEFESFDRTASHMAGEYVAHSIRELTNQEIDDIESMCSVNEQGQINGREFARLILKKASGI